MFLEKGIYCAAGQGRVIKRVWEQPTRLRIWRGESPFEGTDVASLRAAFEEAVDDYLEFCKETGKQPEKPFKGSFNLRLDPELHKLLVSNAMNEGKTLNTFVKDLLQRAVSEISY